MYRNTMRFFSVITGRAGDWGRRRDVEILVDGVGPCRAAIGVAGCCGFGVGLWAGGWLGAWIGLAVGLLLPAVPVLLLLPHVFNGSWSVPLCWLYSGSS
jgi:hypothetical protein